ncbi:MAG TPA: DUF5987 family protein [Solirubrobacteraceae bacterium]|jgi:hypothetical protein
MHPALADITRRQFVARTIASGLAVAAAGGLRAAPAARAAEPSLADGTLQAFADTMIPGSPATITDLGLPIHPRAILGVDGRPGAVEADSLAAGRHPKIGFAALEPAFLADLEARALPLGGPFLELDWDRRVQACLAGLDFGNPARTLWEAAAAIPFVAFCAAAVAPAQRADRASGYRVMGLPGEAPNGYKRASYRRKLARSRTTTGNLP